MSDRDDCSSCPQSRTCKTVYEQLGKATGPSITAKAVVVFLGPIFVFVICLAVLEDRLTALTSSKSVGLLLTVLISVTASLLYILLAGLIMRRIGPHESSCQQKEQNDSN